MPPTDYPIIHVIKVWTCVYYFHYIIIFPEIATPLIDESGSIFANESRPLCSGSQLLAELSEVCHLSDCISYYIREINLFGHLPVLNYQDVYISAGMTQSQYNYLEDCLRKLILSIEQRGSIQVILHPDDTSSRIPTLFRMKLLIS